MRTFTHVACVTDRDAKQSPPDADPLLQNRRCKCPTASYLVGSRNADPAGELRFLAVLLGVVEMLERAGGEHFTLLLLQFAQGGPDDFTGIVVSPSANELLNEILPMVRERNVHGDIYCHTLGEVQSP